MTVADFIADQRTSHRVPHAVSCRALAVSQSWFYKWLGRPPTTRDERRADLALAIQEVFDRSGGTYGSPRVHCELRERGWRVSKNTVAKVMAELGLAGRVKRRRRSLTRQGRWPVAPDLVRRKFSAPAPDVAWCGDMTEIITDEGKLYLATVIDLHSRRLFGYAMDAHHDTELVVGALHMAAATRGGDVHGFIMHTDRGSEYTSKLFGDACERLGVVQSMGRVGSALDNAVAEATNSTLKVEYIHRQRFRARAEARLKIATWITNRYNPHRRHSACGWLPPIDYENRHTVTEQQPQAA
ncbi:putative transposase [Streptomyces sp. NBRC 110611]|uniref:IS3 family transposase n=1 Tax=Streptomyces sp. NBRC 110611 TaxID=1621259 RepID=UPI000856E8FC|nr:IS3 family transposase [Streptomyces sp. NBRC 110611]GAU71674.1 putative transposase [Streptomyces sp. NBRC 110611]